MELSRYPIFAPPHALAAKSHRDWSKGESQIYFDWLMKCLDDRVSTLLGFLGIDTRAIDARSLLALAGERVTRALRDPACSGPGPDGTATLTNIGYALAADLGLLTAKQIIHSVGDRIHWKIVQKPKSDISYNLPVLVGFASSWRTYDPIRASIADAEAVLDGRRSSDAWLEVFDSCIRDAQK